MDNVDRFGAALEQAVSASLPVTIDYSGTFLYSVASFDTGSQTANLKPLNLDALPLLAGMRTRGYSVKFTGESRA